MYPNPMLNQQMAQLDQEYAQKKANIMQSFYSQQQGNNWGQQSVPPQLTTTHNVNWIRVNGIEGAKNQIVQPNETVWMMDNNLPYIYAKAVDKFGTPDFHIYYTEEVSESDTVKAQQTARPQIDMSQYVQRGEFDALKAQLEEYTSTQPKRQQKANKGAEDNG